MHYGCLIIGDDNLAVKKAKIKSLENVYKYSTEIIITV